MDSFWTDNISPLNTTEDYSSAAGGGGVGINISGNDWLGFGSVFGGMTAGTQMCGAKPTCISFGKNTSCYKKQRAFEECVANTLVISSQQLTSQEQQQGNQLSANAAAVKAKKNKTILIVSIVMIAVITTVFIVVRRNKKNTD